MKIEKIKHNHTLTQLLKVGIFAMLMIAPLFAACSQLMYVTFNKNAYQSYTERTYITEQPVYYQTNEVTTYQDLLIGQIYHWTDNYQGTTLDSAKYLFEIEQTENLNQQFNLPDNLMKVEFLIGSNGTPIILGYISINNFIWNYIQNKPTDFVIKNYLGEYSYTENIIQYFKKSELKLVKEYIEVEQNGTLDNAFYFGVETMTESPLFNWTQNTALYTGIKAMTDNLQVQTNVIAVLVTYWTILTIIYIIIDIVLALFTKMTHLLVRSD